MRAVILSIAGLLLVSAANAGSLQVQDTSFSPKTESNGLNLPSFSENGQGGALSFNAIGQGGSVQMFDLGGKTSRPASNDDVFKALQRDLSGAQQAAEDRTTLSK